MGTYLSKLLHVFPAILQIVVQVGKFLREIIFRFFHPFVHDSLHRRIGIVSHNIFQITSVVFESDLIFLIFFEPVDDHADFRPIASGLHDRFPVYESMHFIVRMSRDKSVVGAFIR